MEILCGIYCIENTINQKKYIGQSIDIYRRWQEHKLARTKQTISSAIIKYGINNFSFRIIELCERNLLNEREIYWINYYDTYHNGYNETPGGSYVSDKCKKQINAYDLNGNYIRTYTSCRDAARDNNCSPQQIYLVLNHLRRTAGSMQFRYLNDSTPVTSTNGAQGRHHKTILQLDLNDNIIAEFKTIEEASKITGAYGPSIGRVCRGIKNTTHGFKWRYKEDYLKSMENNI